jgi:UDP-N-acetylmuramoylalanine-D-glutamate ligase
MKSRLFTAMDQQDTGVISDANAETIKTLSGGRCRWISFGRSVQADYRYKNGAIHYRRRNERHAISVTGSLFANDIMGTSAAAATAVLEACGLGGRYVENAVGDFEALPHRMNHVGTIDNVMFIDDSKATNISAMVAALEMCDRPVRLIAGGLLKEGDLAPAEKVLATKVRGLYLIGSAAQKMAEAWGCAVPCHLCERLDVALSKAWKDCSPGEAVLLSPACASFDQFSSFEERGDRFVQLVGKIREEK